MIEAAYKYRIYPNEQQKEYFAKCFGCVRFFYNKSLEDTINEYEKHKKRVNLTPAKYKNDFPFLKEVDSLALANAQLNRNAAFTNFFRKNAEYPKFKSKRSKQSYTTNNQNGTISFSSNDKYINIPKCRNIKIKKHRPFNGIIKHATISKDCDGKYYISLYCLDNSDYSLSPVNKQIGVDLGIKKYLTMSNGRKIDNPKNLTKSQAKLAKEQRKLSHMKKGSNNYNKQKVKIAIVYKKITNQRNDFLQKITTELVKENQIICSEKLTVRNMVKNHKLAKCIEDASWSTFCRYIEYKCKKFGRNYIQVPSNYASSQICSSCGHKNEATKNLGVRNYVCPHCGSKLDRDVNASINILRKGLEIYNKAGTQPVSLLMLDSSESSNKKPPLL